MESPEKQHIVKLIRPNKIRQNLRPLLQNTKKKVAQTLYYQNHSTHQSPLTRDEKAPVHQRLGVKQIRLKRFVPLGTNTSTILPKRKLKFPNVENKFKKNKFQRMYSAQARIERIRAQQRQNNNNGFVKLRRLNRGLPSVTNLTVEVKNPNYVSGNNGICPKFEGCCRFQMSLKPSIQEEIADIQRDRVHPVTPIPPLTRITPVTTAIGMSERFTILSLQI